MPILRGSVSYARFGVDAPYTPGQVRGLLKRLRSGGFRPIDRSSDDERAVGWVELDDPTATEFLPSRTIFRDRMLCSLRIDTLKVPAEELRRALAEWSQATEQKKGAAPKPREKREKKALLIRKLRRTAPIRTQLIDMSWTLEGQALWFWTSSRRVVEEAWAFVEETFGVHLTPVSPAGHVAELPDSLPKLTPTPSLFGNLRRVEVSE